MSAEIFKAAISRQLRDPSSGIHCFLYNFEGKDVIFGHQGLGIRALFLWGETLETKSKDKVHGHQVVFDNDMSEVDTFLDSQKIGDWTFAEETVIFDSGKIVFGLRHFKIEREGFEFRKKYNPEMLSSIAFDIADFGTKKHKESNVTSRWSTECNRAHSDFSGLRRAYMDYRFNEAAQDDLKNLLNKNGIGSKETLEIFHCFEHGIKFGHTAMTGIYRALIQSSNSVIKK